MKLALPWGEECEIVVSKQRVGSFPVETTLFFHLSLFSPSLISQICLFFLLKNQSSGLGPYYQNHRLY